jgi:putative aldouronate transport system permease protein
MMATVTELWKEIGWSAIIYLAAMSGIDPDLYEAAAIDGAGRFRKIRHVTIPGISTTVKLLLVLSIGGLFSAGFEQIILLQRPITINFSEVLDTYVFKMLWSYPTKMAVNLPKATAVGIVNSLVSFLLVYMANIFAKKIDGSGVI